MYILLTKFSVQFNCAHCGLFSRCCTACPTTRRRTCLLRAVTSVRCGKKTGRLPSRRSRGALIQRTAFPSTNLKSPCWVSPHIVLVHLSELWSGVVSRRPQCYCWDFWFGLISEASVLFFFKHLFQPLVLVIEASFSTIPGSPSLSGVLFWNSSRITLLGILWSPPFSRLPTTITSKESVTNFNCCFRKFSVFSLTTQFRPI